MKTYYVIYEAAMYVLSYILLAPLIYLLVCWLIFMLWLLTFSKLFSPILTIFQKQSIERLCWRGWNDLSAAILYLIFPCSTTFMAIAGGMGNDLSTLAVYLIFQCSTAFEAITGGVWNDLSTQAV